MDSAAMPATVHLEEGRLKILIGKTPIGDWGLDEIEFEKVATGYRVAAEGEQILLDLEDSAGFTIALRMSQARPQKRPRKKVYAKKATPEPDRKQARAEKKQLKRASRAKKPRGRGDAAVPKTPLRLPGTPAPAQPLPVEELSKATEEKVSERGSQKKPGGGRLAVPGRDRIMRMVDRGVAAAEKRFGSLLPEWVFTRIAFAVALGALILTVILPGLISAFLLLAGLGLVILGAVVYTDGILASKWLPGRTTPVHVLISGVGVLVLGVLLGVIAP